jgi:DMSO/TMAO reductase YedYZ molybdopterin-dependent catalytic subunit
MDDTMTTPGAAAPEPRLSKGFGAGVGAALTMIFAMAVMRYVFQMVPSIPELLQGVFLRPVPGDVFEFMIHLLGPGAKVLLLVLVLEGMLLVGGLLGQLFVRTWRPAGENAPTLARLRAERNWGGAFYGLLIGLGLLVLFWLLYATGLYNPQPADSDLIPINIELLLMGLVFGLTLTALLPWPSSIGVAALPDEADAERRGILRTAGGVAVALVGGGVLWGILTKMLAEPEQAGLIADTGATGTVVPATGADATATAFTIDDIATAVAESGGDISSMATETPLPAANAPTDTAVPPTEVPPTEVAGAPPTDTAGPQPTDTAIPPTQVAAAPTNTPFPAVPVLSPEITPTDNFYITTKNYQDPEVDISTWSLTVRGMVDKPQTFTFADIKKFPQVKVIHTLACISNPVGGNLIGNARWTGIHFADLLKQTAPQANITDVILRAADEYSDSVPLSVLMHPDCILAYEMNGKPLTARHGFPARLLVPGIFGMKNVKWITSIEPTNYDYKGFWESQGWDDKAPYLTMSRIDYPTKDSVVKSKPLYITGIAFAGNRGIKRVEVSVDGGRSWADAQVRPALGRNAWVIWTYPWVPPKSGDTTLIVRATDGTGKVQTADDVGNYPSGAQGYHRIPIKITT